MNPVRDSNKTRRKNISNGIKIIIKNLPKRIPISPKMVEEAVLKTLSWHKSKKPGQITVCFVNDKQIRELNLMYLGKDEPTDVIAFDMSEGKKEILADIAVSCDTARRQARIFKTTPLYELHLYVIHGILHILGYNDKNRQQRKLMRAKEEYLLKKLKLH